MGGRRVQALVRLQEVSIFLFDKRSVEKLHKPKRRETVTDILRAGATRMERYSHPKLLQVLCIREIFANSLEPFRSMRIYRRSSVFVSHSVDRYTLYLTGDVGVQSGGVRGHIGLRVGAGPRQPGERPGVQGAISKYPRDAILGPDG